jgi:hypothetical protein
MGWAVDKDGRHIRLVEIRRKRCGEKWGHWRDTTEAREIPSASLKAGSSLRLENGCAEDDAAKVRHCLRSRVGPDSRRDGGATEPLLLAPSDGLSCLFVRGSAAFGFALVPELLAFGQG